MRTKFGGPLAAMGGSFLRAPHFSYKMFQKYCHAKAQYTVESVYQISIISGCMSSLWSYTLPPQNFPLILLSLNLISISFYINCKEQSFQNKDKREYLE